MSAECSNCGADLCQTCDGEFFCDPCNLRDDLAAKDAEIARLKESHQKLFGQRNERFQRVLDYRKLIEECREGLDSFIKVVEEELYDYEFGQCIFCGQIEKEIHKKDCGFAIAQALLQKIGEMKP